MIWNKVVIQVYAGELNEFDIRQGQSVSQKVDIIFLMVYKGRQCFLLLFFLGLKDQTRKEFLHMGYICYSF